LAHGLPAAAAGRPDAAVPGHRQGAPAPGLVTDRGSAPRPGGDHRLFRDGAVRRRDRRRAAAPQDVTGGRTGATSGACRVLFAIDRRYVYIDACHAQSDHLPPGSRATAMSDAVQFLRAWITDPMHVASITPSSSALAALITSEITPQTTPVVE